MSVAPSAATPPVVSAEAMREKTRKVISSLVTSAQDYALLDFPAHPNIGDSAIWAGEIALLNQIFGTAPRHVSMHRFAPTQPGRVMSEESVLFLHGGGNFGDIWPHYQTYRIALMEAHPHHRIVQLPQSIHFSDPALIEPTKRAIGEHKDYHLIVRDQASADFARAEFDCPVHMAPDSAFGIDLRKRKSHNSPRNMTTVLRQDKERRDDASGAAGLFPEGSVWDWPSEGRSAQWVQKGILGMARDLPPPIGRFLAPAAFNRLAEWRIERGFRHLDQAKVVVTDRLHGHIMGSVLGKPTVVIDNFYGKIRRFVDAWGSVSPVYLAADYIEARDIAENLLQTEKAKG